MSGLKDNSINRVPGGWQLQRLPIPSLRIHFSYLGLSLGNNHCRSYWMTTVYNFIGSISVIHLFIVSRIPGQPQSHFELVIPLPLPTNCWYFRYHLVYMYLFLFWLLSLFWDSLSSPSWPWTHKGAQDGLELTAILLPEPLKCWDYRHDPPYFCWYTYVLPHVCTRYLLFPLHSQGNSKGKGRYIAQSQTASKESWLNVSTQDLNLWD